MGCSIHYEAIYRVATYYRNACKNAIYCWVGSFIKVYTVAFELFALIVTYKEEKRVLLHLAEKQIVAENS